MKTRYTKAYYLKTLGAIPASKWCVSMFTNDKGQHCVLGHLGMDMDVELNPPVAEGLMKLFDKDNLWEGWSRIININNSSSTNYPQRGPKARVMAALRALP